MNNPRCKYDDDRCGEKYHAKGLCKRHYSREQYAANPEKYLKMIKKWAANNPEKVRMNEINQYQKRVDRMIEWINGRPCYICGGEATLGDHIIPRGKGKPQSGLTAVYNDKDFYTEASKCLPCCIPCNNWKGGMADKKLINNEINIFQFHELIEQRSNEIAETR